YYAYQQGTLDVIPSVPAAMVPTLVAEDENFHVFALLGTYYVNLNMDMALFQNLKLRKALAYSIDREAICEALSAGQIPATGYVPEGFIDNEGNDFSDTAGDFGIVVDDGNYAIAQTLFKEAAVELGYATSVTDTAGLAAFITAVNAYSYMSNNGSGHDLIAQMIIESWSVNLGLTIEYENQEWAVFQNTRQNGDYEMSRGGWLTDYMDPSGMLAIFTLDNAYNDPNYSNANFNTLMTQAIEATDPAVHFAKLYEAQEQLMNDMPIIPLYYYSDTIYIKSYVKGWARSVLGSIDLTRVYIEGK
ncbi:MAG: ABC transporter substrate-binding protein, partial [Candidatus Izemoplasmatales bacterium]